MPPSEDEEEHGSTNHSSGVEQEDNNHNLNDSERPADVQDQEQQTHEESDDAGDEQSKDQSQGNTADNNGRGTEEGAEGGVEDGAEDEDDEEEDDEDDDDEDEDEDDGIRRKRSRNDRQERRNQFLDVEAEVDEDEEDYEEDEDGLIREDGFIQEPGVDEGEDHDDRLHREVDRRRDAIVEADAERLASEYREKYGRSTASKYRGDTGIVPQRLLLPSVQDPNIWGIRCKPGKEKELVRSILKKKLNLQFTRTPLEIYSAFQRDTFTGYVYVEARKQTAVEQALKGMPNVYARNMVLVPIKEYPDMFRVNKSKETELTPGTYVRIKRGKYQGDLAIVENLSENGLEARLKIVPRLDYGKSAVLNNNLGVVGPDGKRKRISSASAKGRPLPRLFSENEAIQYDQRNVQRRGPKSFLYLGEEYENGYLIKDFKITYLITENVAPRLEELTRFNNASEEGIDLQSLSKSLKQSASAVTFQNGDHVEVFSGEQAGMQGKVVATQNNIVTIIGTGDLLKDHRLDIPANNLRKRFSVGDHVRVVNGNFKDETGMVVQADRDRVTLLSDISRSEITVFSRDLKEASDIGGSNTIGKYELHDLVQLSSQLVGVIVNVERDSVGVLGQDGHLRKVDPSTISMKITRTREGFATDRNGQEIRVGDTVREVGGEGKQGVILHIFHSTLFIHDRDRSENLGVFISRVDGVVTVAAKGARGVTSSGPELNKMNPSLQRNNGMPAPMPVNVQRGGGRDRILGQVVTIGRGSQYKGLKGTVRDSTETMARIELEAKNKQVTVEKTKLLFNDSSTGRQISYTEFVVPRRGGGPGFRGTSGGAPNSSVGGSFGSATPSWNGGGGKTPSWASGGRSAWGGGSGDTGGRTPAWNSGGKTPAYGDSSARTPAWNSGSRTPAWNAGAKTPGWSGGQTPSARSGGVWDSGSRTPNSRSAGWFNAGSASDSSSKGGAGGWYEGRTPGASSYDASTPGIGYGGEFGAPTPAASSMGYASTPGAMSAPTPAAFRDDLDTAPTPGVFEAKTPGAVAATPGAWALADEETPRYEPTTP